MTDVTSTRIQSPKMAGAHVDTINVIEGGHLTTIPITTLEMTNRNTTNPTATGTLS